MEMITQLAKENGLDVAATESLFRYMMIRLQDPKHLEAFMQDSAAWTTLAIENWNKNSQQFVDKYFTDEEYRKTVNETVFEGLV